MHGIRSLICIYSYANVSSWKKVPKKSCVRSKTWYLSEHEVWTHIKHCFFGIFTCRNRARAQRQPRSTCARTTRQALYLCTHIQAGPIPVHAHTSRLSTCIIPRTNRQALYLCTHKQAGPLPVHANTGRAYAPLILTCVLQSGTSAIFKNQKLNSNFGDWNIWRQLWWISEVHIFLYFFNNCVYNCVCTKIYEIFFCFYVCVYCIS
jgi:hypothetical protein